MKGYPEREGRRGFSVNKRGNAGSPKGSNYRETPPRRSSTRLSHDPFLVADLHPSPPSPVPHLPLSILIYANPRANLSSRLHPFQRAKVVRSFRRGNKAYGYFDTCKYTSRAEVCLCVCVKGGGGRGTSAPVFVNAGGHKRRGRNGSVGRRPFSRHCRKLNQYCETRKADERKASLRSFEARREGP